MTLTLPDLIAATALANQDYRGPSWHAEPLQRAAVVCAPGWALAESYRLALVEIRDSTYLSADTLRSMADRALTGVTNG